MNFTENKEILINKLNVSLNHKEDIALKRILEILLESENEKELRKNKDLINRIALDSVEDWKNINLISEFLNQKY